MARLNIGQKPEAITKGSPPAKVRRRTFLQFAVLSAGGVAWLSSACKKEALGEGVILGSGDVGILNYLYVLEQLEAAFYTQVTQSFHTGATAAEMALLTDIRDHEIAHREFFKNALGQVAIPTLDIDLSSIDFASRTSVLESARTFEDLGVAAYNGAGALIKDEKYVALTGKVVSVEARHAALIRNLIDNGSFAGVDVVDANGLDRSLSPEEVLGKVSPFIKTALNFEDLPTL
jgi:rubrerythrin